MIGTARLPSPCSICEQSWIFLILSWFVAHLVRSSHHLNSSSGNDVDPEQHNVTNRLLLRWHSHCGTQIVFLWLVNDPWFFIDLAYARAIILNLGHELRRKNRSTVIDRSTRWSRDYSMWTGRFVMSRIKGGPEATRTTRAWGRGPGLTFWTRGLSVPQTLTPE